MVLKKMKNTKMEPEKEEIKNKKTFYQNLWMHL